MWIGCVGWEVGWSGVWCLDCLVGFLVWVGCLVNGSIGYWIHSSVVWCDSGSLRLSAILWSVGRLVGQALGRLFGWSVGRWVGF